MLRCQVYLSLPRQKPTRERRPTENYDKGIEPNHIAKKENQKNSAST